MSAPHEPDDATGIAERVARGDSTARDEVERALASVERLDARLGAVAALRAREARAEADALDRRLAAGESAPPLAGVPLLLKANQCLAGARVHCGSRLLEDWVAPYTASFVERAQSAGCVVVGHAHMDEFAMGSSGEHSAFGPTRNPWDARRVPGGSSSGGAAAVAGGLVPLALGSDTGGSVRQPAALCGVSGFKPTYGRIPRHGLVAFGSSLDQVAPLARSVRDLERCTRALAGHDARDATSLHDVLEPETDHAPASLDGVRVGVPHELLANGIEPGVRAAFDAALGDLERLGARVSDVAVPHAEHALAAYYVVAAAEASSNLARFDGVRYGRRVEGDGSLAGMIAATRTAGFGDEVKRRILLGTFVLSAGYQEQWYGKATALRARLARDFADVFAAVDLVATPTSPTVAFRIGERADPVAMYAADVLTVPASLAGLPAVSVPCGLAEAEGRQLPVGLQLLGARGDDARVLRGARAFQEATAHHLARPPEGERG